MEWKDRLIENNMSRNDDAPCCRVIATIAFVVSGVAKENTGGGGGESL